MNRRTPALLVAVIALAGTACADDGVGTRAGSVSGDIAYYETPGARDSGERGEILSDDPIRLAGLSGEGHRVTYVSTTPADDTVHLTGVVIVPEGPEPEGGRPVAIWGHPTVGVGTECAPSLTEPFGLEGAQQFLDAGFVVAAPDYDGLGSEGTHPYLVGESEGRATLDMALAAENFGGNGTVVSWGHSQGGHAALWSRAIAPDYAPDLDLRATGAAAPPTDLGAFLDPGFVDPLILPITASTAAAWSTVHNGVDLSPLATPEALEAADDALESCIIDIAVATTDVGPSDIWQLGPDDVPDWRRLTAAHSVDPARGSGPVFVSHGGADTVVPIGGTQALVDALCAEGETVVYRTETSWTHGAGYTETRVEMFDWLIAAANNADLTSTC